MWYTIHITLCIFLHCFSPSTSPVYHIYFSDNVSIQIVKLKQDNKDLLEELTAIHQQEDGLELTNKALYEKEQIIEILQNDLEKSQAAFQMQQKRNMELSQMISLLKAENKQYAMILDKLQKDETSMKDKIAVESEELRTLQLQYALLHREKEESDMEATRATLHAAQLSSQIHDVQNALQVTLSHKVPNGDNDSLETDEFAAFSGVGQLSQNNKTMKFSAPTSPLDAMTGLVERGATDRSMRGFFGFAASDQTLETEAIDDISTPEPYALKKRESDDGSGTHHSSGSAYDGHRSAKSGSVNPKFYDYNSNPGYFNLEQNTGVTSVLSDCDEVDEVDASLAFHQDFEDRINAQRETLLDQHQVSFVVFSYFDDVPLCTL